MDKMKAELNKRIESRAKLKAEYDEWIEKRAKLEAELEAELNELDAELKKLKAEYEAAMAAEAEEDAQKNLHEDYQQRYCQVNEQIETLRKNLETTTLDPMEVTDAVQKGYQDGKE